MSRGRILIPALVAAVALAAGSARADAPQPRVLLIGDSVATGMLWHPAAIAVMQERLDVDWQVAICRTLTGTSCPFDGERPPTLVELVASLGRVPPTVVVVMGYNDPAGTFASGLDAAMSSLTKAGAQHVLWLTLRAARDPYPVLDRLLEQATARWPQLELVDWNGFASGHPDWFQNDGVHLLEAGGIAMAHLAHGAALGVLDPLRAVTPQLRLRAGHPYALRLRATGGTPPYRWRVAAGRPPHGFHLLSDGRISAHTAAGARAAFIVAVTDADGVTADMAVSAG